MKSMFNQRQIALAALAALAAGSMIGTPTVATAAGKAAGKYVAGDFHNHTTCSDGSISMQKLVNKATAVWGLDWFVQAGHGGNGNRNCTLAEDASLATPAYPLTAQGPTTTWQNTVPPVQPKGLASGTSPNQNMWRWQSVQEFQYPMIEYLSAYKNVPLFLGLESVGPGHEHISMSIINGQMPLTLDNSSLPTSPVIAANTSRYAALGNANALAQWEYCFDRADTDNSRGGANSWSCAVNGSDYSNTALYTWDDAAKKLTSNNGNAGHAKTLEALKWMVANSPLTSYYVPAHLERAGPFNVNGSNGFNIEHLRNFNNLAPNIAFGFESQPGHGAANNRGEYQVIRNSFAFTPPGASKPDTSNQFTNPITGAKQNIDSVGGTTYGGTGVYAAQVGGVWDALLGEGRNWWFFASSDWHNRGSFGPDDRRSTQDFQPGEYQRTNVLARNGSDKIRPQYIVNALRTGNAWSASGQLIDRLAFVACASYPGIAARSNAQVEAIALQAAANNTDIDVTGCATMGEKLKVRPGAEIVVSIVVRDPAGTNNSPYTFANPSLAQIGISQPLNQPVLDHIDLIRGMVTGYKTPGAADYSGEWPRNTNWLKADGSVAGLSAVPAGAKNTSASILKTFAGGATPTWTQVASPVDNTPLLKMTLRIPAVQASQYLRLRGTNLPPATPYETDASGNPLPDLFTNSNDTTMLRIPCTVAHSSNSQFDGCPDHLATATSGTNLLGLAITNPIAGKKAVSYDVAAWSDLWFYSNPIYVEVAGATTVAGVK